MNTEILDSTIPEQKRHSTVGIVAFVMVLLYVVIGLPGFFFSIDRTEDLVIGIIVIGGWMWQFVALIVGIIGLTQNHRKRLFALLSVVLNALLLILWLLIIIGVAVGA